MPTKTAPPKTFVRAREDDLVNLQSQAHIWTYCFDELEIEQAKSLRQTLEELLKSMDQHMTPLLTQKGTEGDMVNWATRMQSCKKMFDAVDKNLNVYGQSSFRWNEVREALGFIKALTEITKFTFWANHIDEF